jgi:hypothetical protein
MKLEWKLAITTTAVVILAGLFSDGAYTQQTSAQESSVNLSAGADAPGASGVATIGLVNGVAVGEVEVDNLPAQPFGSGRFYGVWFVRTDTEDKAFLGALIHERSIIFSTPGDGETGFSATKFTTGKNAGKPITFGPAGKNLIIVLIENVINGLTPSPVGVAVNGTF